MPRSGWRRTRPRWSKRTTRRRWRARLRNSSSGSRQDVIDAATPSRTWKRSTRDREPVSAAAVSILLLPHHLALAVHEHVGVAGDLRTLSGFPSTTDRLVERHQL